MVKIIRRRDIIILFLFILYLVSPPHLYAYWVWTPEKRHWENPQSVVLDPEAKFNKARQFFEEENYNRAIKQFRLLIKAYPHSSYAPRSQYYIGRCLEEKHLYYAAFLAYQKVISKYPYTDLVPEIVARQFGIGELFYKGYKTRFLGLRIPVSKERAIEIFTQVLENGTYTQYGRQACYYLGRAYSEMGNYAEARKYFKQILQDYSEDSLLVEKANFEIAYTYYKASLSDECDQRDTEEAMKRLEVLMGRATSLELINRAKSILEELRNKKARYLLKIAEFYDRQRQIESAKIYYREIAESYKDSVYAMEAKRHLVSNEMH